MYVQEEVYALLRVGAFLADKNLYVELFWDDVIQQMFYLSGKIHSDVTYQGIRCLRNSTGILRYTHICSSRQCSHSAHFHKCLAWSCIRFHLWKNK